MKKRYEVPRIEMEEVRMHTHLLTMSNGKIGTEVEDDDSENVFTKESDSQNDWDIEW